jgi:hypothetical protein
MSSSPILISWTVVLSFGRSFRSTTLMPAIREDINRNLNIWQGVDTFQKFKVRNFEIKRWWPLIFLQTFWVKLFNFVFFCNNFYPKFLKLNFTNFFKKSFIPWNF